MMAENGELLGSKIHEIMLLYLCKCIGRKWGKLKRVKYIKWHYYVCVYRLAEMGNNMEE
jgi:hypothetical protein